MSSSDKAVILVATDLAPEDIDLLLRTTQLSENMLIVSDEAGLHPSENLLVLDLEKSPALHAAVTTWQTKKGTRFVGVIGLDEEYHYDLSTGLAEHLGLTHHSAESRRLVGDKWTQRTKLSEDGIRVPDMTVLTAATALPAGTLFPNVLKPLTGVGGIATYLNHDEKEFQKHLTSMKQLHGQKDTPLMLRPFTRDGEQVDPTTTFLLEEYIAGEEFSCDYLVHENSVEVLRVVKKLPATFPYFAGFILLESSLRSAPFTEEALRALCAKTADALGIQNGVCMMDFKYAKEFVVIETTLRPGIAEFIDLQHALRGSTSLDIAISQCLDAPLNPARNERTGLVSYLFAPTPGHLIQFDTNRLETEKSLKIIKIVKHEKEGALLHHQQERPNAPIIIGHVLVECAPEAAESLAKEINTLVTIEVEP